MRTLLFVFSALVAASRATACELDSPTARLPGFSDQQAEERAYKMWSDWRTIGHYERTAKLVEEASRTYLARVTKVEKDDDNFRTRTTIQPLRPIKGEMPTGLQVLVGFRQDSCGGANGDGDSVYTTEADLIIVFEGVSKRANRPNGIDSVRVVEVRSIDLLDEVQAWLNTLPGYKPYD